MTNDSLIILAAGLSSRMKKSVASNNLSENSIIQANEIEKGLIGIGEKGKPLIHYLLFNAKSAGFKKIYFVIGENSSSFKNYFSKNLYPGLTFYFATQYLEKDRVKPSGTADALFQALFQFKELRSKDFCVCNSDNLYSISAFKKIRLTNAINALISYDKNYLKFSNEKISSFSILQLDDQNFLLDIIEKPNSLQINKFQDHKGITRVSMNLFKFNGMVFYEYLKNCPFNEARNEKELPTAVLNLAKSISKSVLGIPHAEHVPDLTSKKDIEILSKIIESNYFKK